MIVLGDAIDRGPNSARVMEMLLEMQRRCRLIFVLGNHEQMMLEALETGVRSSMWVTHGGDATLASYGGLPEHIPERHLEFFSHSVPYWETETDIYVHANLDVAVPLDQQSARVLRWQHLTGHEMPHPSGRRIICGHTPQPNGLPRVIDGWVCIDTYAYGGLFLTAIDVDTNEVFQANQAGQSRKGVRLDDLA